MSDSPKDAAENPHASFLVVKSYPLNHTRRVRLEIETWEELPDAFFDDLQALLSTYSKKSK